MEESLAHAAQVAGLAIESVAVLIVAYGAIEAFARLLIGVATGQVGHGSRKSVWRGLGLWLLLGLEFELAADIIGSAFAPSWDEVGKLGAIAVIRTFLNYFLERDLDEARAEAEAPAIVETRA